MEARRKLFQGYLGHQPRPPSPQLELGHHHPRPLWQCVAVLGSSHCGRCWEGTGQAHGATGRPSRLPAPTVAPLVPPDITGSQRGSPAPSESETFSHLPPGGQGRTASPRPCLLVPALGSHGAMLLSASSISARGGGGLQPMTHLIPNPSIFPIS